MKRLKEFWKQMNYPADLLNNILTEPAEGSEEVLDDPVELAKTFAETQKKLILNGSGLFSKEHMDKEFITHRRKLASDINKSFKLGFTRSQLDEMDWNTFTDKAKELYETSLAQAGENTDEKINTLIHNLKSEKATLAEQLQKMEDEIENKVAARTKELEDERNAEAVERVFHEVFNDPDFVWNEKSKKRDQFFIKNTVLDNYEVHKDRKLTQEGGKEAVNFTGNGHYKDLKEAVKYLYESEQMSPKHKGGAGDEKKTPVLLGKVKMEGDLSPNSKALMERAIKYRQGQGMDT